MEIVKDVVSEEETNALSDGKYSQTFLAKVLAGKNEYQIKEILGFIVDGCDIVLETYAQPTYDRELGMKKETEERFKVIDKKGAVVTFLSVDFIGSDSYRRKIMREIKNEAKFKKAKMLSTIAFYVAFLSLTVAIISLLA